MALSVAGWGLDRLFDYEMSHGLFVVLAIGGALIAGGILQYKGNVENAMKCYESGYRTGHVIGHEAAARQVGQVDPELAQALADLYSRRSRRRASAATGMARGLRPRRGVR